MPDPVILTIGPPLRHIEIDGDALYLGRDCLLALTIPALLSKVVSNRHCALRKEGENRWMLEDLGSTNGTWIRGTRLFGKVVMHSGDTFTLGKNGPVCECLRGFGGTGANATIPEEELRASTHNFFVDPSQRPTIIDGRDGSDEHPYKVGRTPEVTLRHERTGAVLTGQGYTLIIGRDVSVAQLLVRTDEEKHVSGRHCEIQFRSDGTVVLRDLDSKNGTWLNDIRVKGEMPIKEGDRLTVGASVTILRVVKLVKP